MSKSITTEEKSTELTTKKIFNLLDQRFNKSYILYEHLHNSYNECVNNIIDYLKTNANIFNESRVGDTLYRNKIKYEDILVIPATLDHGKTLMYGNDARNKNITYSIRFMAKITQIQELYDLKLKKTIETRIIAINEKDEALSLPVMVRSKYCSLTINKNSTEKHECDMDPGGYFIINGSEKVILSIERMIENKPLVFLKKDGETNIYTVSINSKPQNSYIMMQSIKVVLKKNYDMMLSVPIFNEVSVFVLIRALGIETDKEIMEYVIYDKNDVDMLNILKISIDSSKKNDKKLILSKNDAINVLINKLKVNKKFVDKNVKLEHDEKVEHLLSLLETIFMPHVSPDKHNDILKTKAIFLGFMINKLLNCYLGRTQPDDRDSFINKRIDMAGDLIFDLFKQNHNKVLKDVNSKVFNKRSETNHIKPLNIINQLKPSTIKQNIDSAIALGTLGKKVGAAQVYPRLTFLQSISYLMRINTPNTDTSMSKLTGPRHYHPSQFGFLCVTGDTEILMSDGSVKLIKDVRNGDWVMTAYKDTLNEIASPIKNWFCKMPENNLLEISTLSGRKIKCTTDHKILTVNIETNEFTMIEAKNLTTNHNIIVKHYAKYIAKDKETIYKINSTTTNVNEQYKRQLDELGYLDRNFSENKLIIIAKLIGLNVTDGNVGITKDGYYNCSFCVGENIDAFQVFYDIQILSFGTASISNNETTHVNKNSSKHTIYKTIKVEKNGAFAYLMHLMGAFVGKKTEMKRNVPEWIKNANNKIQIAYLNGLISGDGCRITFQKNCETNKLAMGNFTQSTSPEFLQDTITYLTEISEIFKKYNVLSKVIQSKTVDENNKYQISIDFENSFENIYNFVQIIDYYYCNDKRKNSMLPIEYILYRNQILNEKKEQYVNIIKLSKEGKKTTEISKTLNVKQSICKRVIEELKKNNIVKPRPTSSSDDVLSFFEFCNTNKINSENKTLYCKINKIIEIPKENVYDFETEYETHTFWGASILISNCSVETPEHANVGQIKHLTITSSITCPTSKQGNIVYNLIKTNNKFIHLDNHSALQLSKCTKILLNGDWIGITEQGYELYKELFELKLNNIINKLNSVVYDIKNLEIRVLTESGRLYRPLLTVRDNKILLTDKIIDEVLKTDVNNMTKWDYLMMKYPETINFVDDDEGFYSVVSFCYKNVTDMYNRQNKVYPDNNKLVINRYDDATITQYTYCEIHESLVLGIISANIPFPDHNQGPRNIFQYAQGRQAMGIYSSNYRNRTDISYILYNTQRPIVSSRLARYIHTDILPCGENCVVLLACYTGHGQEDAIIANKGAIERGLFRSISTRKWESKIEKNQSTSQDEIFKKPDPSIVQINNNANYEKLNDDAYVDEETEIVDGDVIIGKITPIQQTGNTTKPFKDSSKIYKHNEVAIVDKVFNNIFDSDGYEMKKIRTRAEEIPMIGDKFCMVKRMSQVLTNRGWQYIEDITMKDKIATLVDGHKLVYENPTGIYQFNYTGKIYKVRSQQVDIDVTIDHQMYVKKRDCEEFELLSAHKIVGEKYKFKTNWNNNNNNNNNNNENEQFILIDNMSINNTIAKINSFTYNDFDMLEIIDKILKYNKHELKYMCSKFFNNQDNKYKLNVNETNEKIINILTHLIIQSGCSYKLENEFIQIIYEGIEPTINYDEIQDEIYDYDGPVECLEVPSHVFMIRQNGKNVWTGNCCYTEDHDVLTTDGWVSIKDVTTNHYVATMIETNKLKYTKPIAVQQYDYKGKMYNVKSNQIDLMVTPNHRMYVKHRNWDNFKIVEAEKCYGKAYQYQKNIGYYIPVETKTGFIDYNDYTFVLPKTDNLPELKLNLEAWLKFFGIWIAEGCTLRDYGVSFATHKQRVKDELEKINVILNFNTHKHKDQSNDEERNAWVYTDKRLVTYIKPLSVGAVNKSLPQWVWELKMNDCKFLIDGMMLGDGHTMTNGTRRYDTSSTSLANDFQKLCLHAGYSTNITLKYEAGHVAVGKTKTITSTTDAYRMTIIETQNTPLVNKNIKKDGTGRLDNWIEDFDGKVYCCSVEGEGVIYVRRNNYPVWCGNSRHGQKGVIGLILPQSEMPFTESGMYPDLIINPVGIAGRMTFGHLLECLLGKVSAISCREGDGTCFSEVNVDEICDELEHLGYNRFGTETVYCGFTGQKFKSKMFIGPTYYQRLKHLVADKMYCLRVDNTEVLTNRGWKKYGEFTIKDKIATLVNGELTYQIPLDIFYYPLYKGKMYCVNNENIELHVTADHRMYVKTDNNDNNENDNYHFRFAKEMNNDENYYYKKDAKWLADDYYFRDSEIIDIKHNEKNNTNLFVILFVMFIKYKTLFNEFGNITITIANINNCKNDYEIIIDTLNKLNFIYIVMENLIVIDKKYTKYYEKLLETDKMPKWLFLLSRKQCLLLFELLDIQNIYIHNKHYVDGLMQLSIHAGLICNIVNENNDSWKLNFTNNDKFNNDNYTCYDYNSDVFCVTVSSEVFMVRVNGKACWTGNSRARGFVTMLTHQPPEGKKLPLYIFKKYMQVLCML